MWNSQARLEDLETHSEYNYFDSLKTDSAFKKLKFESLALLLGWQEETYNLAMKPDWQETTYSNVTPIFFKKPWRLFWTAALQLQIFHGPESFIETYQRSEFRLCRSGRGLIHMYSDTRNGVWEVYIVWRGALAQLQPQACL